MRTQEELQRVERVATALFIAADPDLELPKDELRALVGDCIQAAILFAWEWHRLVEHGPDDPPEELPS